MLSFQRWNGLRQDLAHWSPTVNSSYIFRCCSNSMAQESTDRKTITTKYSLNDWGIRWQFSSHTLYMQTSKVLSFWIKSDLHLILAAKRTRRPLVGFLVTCLSKEDGKCNANHSREQWFEWGKIIVLHVRQALSTTLNHRKRKICPTRQKHSKKCFKYYNHNLSWRRLAEGKIFVYKHWIHISFVTPEHKNPRWHIARANSNGWRHRYHRYISFLWIPTCLLFARKYFSKSFISSPNIKIFIA